MSATPHAAIAIDGPAASGKSTIARRLAARLGLVVVNSGAMYRAVTWEVLRRGIDPLDGAAVVAALADMEIACGVSEGHSTILINGANPGDELRGERVNRSVSAIAAVPAVRERLVALQRGFRERMSVVMEGRDIGSVVFPDTPFKLYIDASEEVRQARRAADGECDKVSTRDEADSSRATAPLKIAEGAAVLDTSLLDVDETIEAVLKVLAGQGWAGTV
jgi:cytidylate kinase